MNQRKPWTHSELKQLEAMYSEDISYDVIARRLDRTEKAIKQQCSNQGFSRKYTRSRDFKLSERQENEIVRLYRDEKMSMYKIAASFGMSRHFIRKVLRQNGVTFRTKQEDFKAGITKPKRIIPFEDFYRAYYMECLTVDEIKKRFGCGYSTITSNLEIHGLANLSQAERMKIRDQYKNTGKTLKYIKEKQEAL